VLAIIEQLTTHTHYLLPSAAIIIAAGSLLTCITRTRAIAAQLKAGS